LIEASFIQYKCSEDEYNPLATLLLNTEGTVIKALLNKLARFDYAPLAIYFVIWYIFTVITYGTMVPAGLFLPGILIGCALGRMVGLFIENTIIREIKPSTYAIIGSASVLAGYTRLSFSLAVIMLETTENVGLFLPIIFALFISFGVGRIFNRSIYIGSIRNKNIPFLVSDVPESNKGVTAGQLMTSGPLVSLGEVATVAQIYEALTKAEVNS
jgi:chloride channel 7